MCEVFVDERVGDAALLALGLHHAGGPQDPEVLTHQRLWGIQPGDQLVDEEWAVEQLDHDGHADTRCQGAEQFDGGVEIRGARAIGCRNHDRVRSGGVSAGAAGAVGAGAVGALVRAVGALTDSVVVRAAGALGAGAHSAGVGAAAAGAGVALVVVGAVRRIVLAMHVPVVEVIDVVCVDHRLVAAARAVGVAV